MDPSREELHWYSEHGSSLKASLLRTPKTIMMMLLPHRFWREVSVMTEVRLKALGCWIFVLLLLMHLVASIPVSIGAWMIGDRWLNGSFTQYLEIHGVMGVSRILFNGVFSEVAYLEFQNGGGLKLYLGDYYATGLSGAYLIPFGYGAMAFVWFIVLMVVPTTRRMAKLRAAHVVRAGLLSLLASGMIYEISRFAVGVVTSLDAYPLWTDLVGGLVFLLFAVWMLLFWGAAVRIGWRIRPSWLLIVLGSIASALGGIVMVLMPMHFI